MKAAAARGVGVRAEEILKAKGTVRYERLTYDHIFDVARRYLKVGGTLREFGQLSDEIVASVRSARETLLKAEERPQGFVISKDFEHRAERIIALIPLLFDAVDKIERRQEPEPVRAEETVESKS